MCCYEKSVVAVVVTYNRKELLKTAIEKIMGQSWKECDILIVDNGSTDGTDKLIYDQFSFERVRYYNTGENLGGAGGFEFGVKKATELGYDYIWMMDDDTWPESDALKALLQADALLGGEWGFLSSVAYWTDGSICKMNIQKKNIFRHVTARDYNYEVSKIQMCSFVSLLVKAEIVKEIGLPIGEYFIWTDDYEFTGRISKNYQSYMVPSSKVVHNMEKHSRVVFSTESPSRMNRYHYIYRNDVHCYRQYGIIGWIYIVLKVIYTVMDILLRSKGNKINKIKIVLQGIKEGLSFNPQIHF